MSPDVATNGQPTDEHSASAADVVQLFQQLDGISRLRAAGSIFADRRDFAAQAGLSFNGRRNLDESLGRVKDLSPEIYRAAYNRGGIAERIVEAYPKATWRGGFELIDDEDPDISTEFETAWAALAHRLKIGNILVSLDIAAGLGEYAGLLLGAPGETLAEELPKINADELLFLRPYLEEHLEIQDSDLEADRFTARYGLPNFYTATIPGRLGNASTEKVHWTRIIHIAEGTLTDPLRGKPRLRALFDDWQDLRKVTGGGAEAHWLRGNPGLQVDIPPEVQYKAEDVAALQEQVDRYEHKNERVLNTRGVTVRQLEAQVSPFKDAVDTLLKLISAITGIPERILSGSERGELASSQDRVNWHERIADRRENYAGPMIVRPLVDRLIEYGALPAPTNGDYAVRWEPLDSLTQAERADIAVKLSEANEKSVRAGAGLITPVREIRDRVLLYPPVEEVLDDDALDAFTDLPEPAPTTAGESDPAWKAIHEAADRHERRIARLFVDAFEEARDAVDMDALRASLAEEGTREAEDVLAVAVQAVNDALSSTLADRLLDVLAAGGKAGAAASNREGRFVRQALFDTAFDVTNEAARRWAEERSAQLIVEITAATLEGIRAILADAFAAGQPPRVAARRIRELVGLTSREARAVVNLRSEILAAKPGSLIQRANGKFRIRIPKEGISVQALERRVEQYRQRLHFARAVRIARTETIAASNEGQRQLWLQAVERGELPRTARREWIVTPDDRLDEDVCKPMAGQKRAIDEPFTTPGGDPVMGPPAHPGCRCAVGIAEDERIEDGS